jgi:hypothetical protein
MNAVLLISARHLSFLDPDHASYRRAAVLHLAETLHIFRSALDQPMAASNADAFIATSVLLVHHAWALDDDAVIETQPSPLHSFNLRLDFARDSLLSLSQGQRSVFLKAQRLIAQDQSIFAAPARYHPRTSLEQEARRQGSRRCYDLWVQILKAFQDDRPKIERQPTAHPDRATYDQLPRRAAAPISNTPTVPRGLPATSEDKCDAELAGFMDAASRLTLLLGLFPDPPQTPRPASCGDSTLPSDVGDGVDCFDFQEQKGLPPLSDLARYMFSFPTRSADSFINLVQHRNPWALLLMYLFYQAVIVLLPEEQCWWSRRRARTLAIALEQALQAQGNDELNVLLRRGKNIIEGSPREI